jgi:threonyl-tRNA synthetase
MDSLELTLPDGSVRRVAPGTTPLDVAKDIGPGLAKAAVGAELDGRRVDLRQPLARGGDFKLFTTRSPEAGDFVRHSAEHVLADAVQRLWPGTEIDAGRQDHSEKYQYDFRFARSFTPEDLEKIEDKMREIVAEDHEIERVEVTREEAEELFRERGENLKLDRLKDIPEGDTITVFRHGPFADLCRGLHVQRLSQIGAVKLLDTSGSYYRGDETGEKLQRVYGTAFGSKKELQAYLDAQEQARARDHRKLGQELDLFSFDPIAPASPFFHPKGGRLYNLLVDYIRDLYERYGYGEVITPQILDVELWHTSGHYDNYRDAMYFAGPAQGEDAVEGVEAATDEAEGRRFAVKPMNCPTHCLIYGTRMRSYRDLPIRYADFGRLHRYERSGVTAGLMRVRTFAQDDAHIFCTPEQVEEEVLGVVEMILEVYQTFGFSNVEIEVSTRPEKSLGTDEMWEKAEAALQGALDGRGIEYGIDAGGGAFYGPKIDFKVTDALGRPWQLGTVQLDYSMPERFDLAYVGADGGEHRPVMIHRAMLGSIERFLGVLIEHTAGQFPVWLAPVQAVVLPVSDKFAEYGAKVRDELAARGLRVELDERSEKLGYKIREAQLQKVPYMLVVGGKEQEEGSVAVRLRGGRDLGAMKVDAFAGAAGRVAEGRSPELDLP